MPSAFYLTLLNSSNQVQLKQPNIFRVDIKVWRKMNNYIPQMPGSSKHESWLDTVMSGMCLGRLIALSNETRLYTFALLNHSTKTCTRHTGGIPYKLHVLMRHADTYWWKSCWIYRRQLMWCKTQHSKLSVGSWVWARPNQCCTLSSQPCLVISFYIRFGFLLTSVCTTFFLVACY